MNYEMVKVANCRDVGGGCNMVLESIKRFFGIGQVVPKNSSTYYPVSLIILEFSKFLARGYPPIPDCSLLPFPKQRIRVVLKEEEERLCSRIKAFGSESDAADPSKELLTANRALSAALLSFADIEPVDRPTVSYFNKYADMGEIPDHESREFMDLYMKYKNIGMMESGFDVDAVISGELKSKLQAEIREMVANDTLSDLLEDLKSDHSPRSKDV